MVTTSTTQLPIPPFFDESKAGQIWQVPYTERAAQALAWTKQHGITPAAKDQTKFILMIIDGQVSFCLPEGELFVAGRSGRGAVEDAVRLAQFIYRNLGSITQIALTMDTHVPYQIFHPPFWVDANGNHPAPFTLISVEDVESGRWQPNPAISHLFGNYMLLQRHARHYVRELEKNGKYALTIWPFHTMLGGVGHAILPIIEEAVFFHAIARSSQPNYQIKGGNPLTENYSVLKPEVMTGPNGMNIGAQKNVAFIKTLLDGDIVAAAGEAASHCFAWSVDDLLGEISSQDRSLAAKVYLLEDCTSPVVIPNGIDYTDDANNAFRRFEAEGMHVVRSTDPLSSWPGAPF